MKKRLLFLLTQDAAYKNKFQGVLMENGFLAASAAFCRVPVGLQRLHQLFKVKAAENVKPRLMTVWMMMYEKKNIYGRISRD